MYWSLVNWEMWGAIGQWAGAIATTAAVIVALKAARDASAVKVRVAAAIGFQAAGGEVSETVVIISATNVGQRRVELVGTGVVMPNTKQLVSLDQSAGAVRKVLEESQETRYYVEAWRFAAALAKEGYRGETKLQIYFDDSHGVRHRTNWRFTPETWLARME
jgi:hypothetical protein